MPGPPDDRKARLPRFLTGGSYDPPPMARWKVLAWLGVGAFGAPLVLKLSGATLDDDAAFVLVFAVPFCVFMGLMWSLDVNMSRRAPWGALAIFSTFLSAALGILWLAPAPTAVPWS